ncbi:MAG: hypothetical protein NVS3B18_09080 [Candidatus Dormibacteria bacterium]
MVIPTPTRNQLLFAGGALALGAIGIVEAPIALGIAALPVAVAVVNGSRGTQRRSASRSR